MGAKGFTLLEIVITLALLGLSIYSATHAFNQGYFQLGTVEDQQTAIALTEARLETLRDTTFASIVNAARAAVSGYSTFDQQVSVVSTFADLKEVTVTTCWPVQNGEENTSLTTYIGS